MKILLASTDNALLELIQDSLKRFAYEWLVTNNGADVLQYVITHKIDLVILEYDLPKMDAVEIFRRILSLEKLAPPPAILLTKSQTQRKLFESEHIPKVQILSVPIAMRTLVSAVQRILSYETQITCLGGGTGLFTLLSGLKTLPGVSLTSIVSMSDDGGSTGMLRDIFGMLPPGDIRRSLVALSTAPDLLNQLIQYRFQKGKGLEGHNVGNLLLTALYQMRGSMTMAVRALSEILNIQGRVIPVTESINTLKAELEDGTRIEGEHRIDLFEGYDSSLRIKKIWQEPEAQGNPDALEAIYNSQFIILGPGDLYTSLISNLVVKGIPEAIRSSRAKKIYICNVMTKPGETTHYQVSDHIREMVQYLGSDDLDYVLCSSTKFDAKILETYSRKHQTPVQEMDRDSLRSITKAKIIWADVASNQILLRHDSLKLAAQLQHLIHDEYTGENRI